MPDKTRFEPASALKWMTRALGGRISIPLGLIRNRLEPISDQVVLELEAVSPGVRIRGQAHALGAPITFTARVDAEGVHVEGEHRTVRLRMSEVELQTDEDAPGPLADAIRNGLIDTDNPATLIGNMISLPDMIVEAAGKDLVLDLMLLPAVQKDETLRAALEALTSYLCVTGVCASDDAIELQLGWFPGGAREAALSTARAALTPAVRFLWPEGMRR